MRPSPPPTVILGRGRLGRALSTALGRAGSPPVVFGGREGAAEPGLVLSALERAGPGAILLLAIRDDALDRLSSAIARSPSKAPEGRAALHHSGAVGLDVLGPLAAGGFSIGSCHPLQTFTGSPEDAGRFEGTVFATDGDEGGRAAAERLARALGGRPVALAAGARALYHLAASLGANGLTGLVAAARDGLAAAGLGSETALEALGPLLRSALEEALRLGPEAALTGPVARGDEATLERHRRALLAWDASRAALFESLLREQRRLAGRGGDGTEC